MIKKEYNGVEIKYKEIYEKEIRLIEENYNNIFNTIKILWGIKRGKFLKIYIINSKLSFIFYEYPIIDKIISIITLPYYLFSIRKVIEKNPGGFYFKKKNPIIFLKPMKTYGNFNSKVGDLISYKKTIEEAFLSVFCNLLVYITFYPFNIPMWIGQGLAKFTGDKFLKKFAVRDDTVSMFKNYSFKEIKVHEGLVDNKIKIAYHHAKGYWTVRYLEENYPEFLKETFKNYSGEDIVEQIILKLGLDSDNYWEQLDELLYENYKHLLEK